jgi:hypothetical protein
MVHRLRHRPSRSRLRHCAECDVSLSMSSRRPSGDVPDEARLSASNGNRFCSPLSRDEQVAGLHSCSYKLDARELEEAVSPGMSIARDRAIGEIGGTPAREPGGDKPFALHSYVTAVWQPGFCDGSSAAACVDSVDRSAILIWGDQLSGKVAE